MVITKKTTIVERSRAEKNIACKPVINRWSVRATMVGGDWLVRMRSSIVITELLGWVVVPAAEVKKNSLQ